MVAGGDDQVGAVRGESAHPGRPAAVPGQQVQVGQVQHPHGRVAGREQRERQALQHRQVGLDERPGHRGRRQRDDQA